MKKMIMTMVLGALMACLVPALAQTQQWQSTSTMQGTGSTLAPQVTAVGATTVGEMATTTGSAKAPGGPRRSESYSDDDWGYNPQIGEGNEGSPIGDAVIPLLVMLAIYCATRVYRLRRL